MADDLRMLTLDDLAGFPEGTLLLDERTGIAYRRRPRILDDSERTSPLYVMQTWTTLSEGGAGMGNVGDYDALTSRPVRVVHVPDPFVLALNAAALIAAQWRKGTFKNTDSEFMEALATAVEAVEAVRP